MKEMNHNKVVKAGVSGLVIMGLIAGSVEYAGHTYLYDHAVAKVVEQSVEQTEKVTPAAAAEQSSETGEISKEETVYVTLKADGQTDKIIVSNWLKNSAGAGTVSDLSSLKDIINTKGDEKFTQDGENLNWETSNEDIYYQGTSTEQLPVGISIQYELDGKEVQPADIVGKSGKLTMRIQYSNTSQSQVKINDKSEEIYTPFVMITGMILPVEKFTNVEIDHGQVVSEGDNDIVVAYGMPGLKDSLALDDMELSEDIDLDTDKMNDKLTDTVEITADVKDFSMGPTYTVATTDMFKDLDITNMDDVDDLEDKMDDIMDASSQLVDGSKTLQEGLETLDENFVTYSNAIDTVNKGVKDLDKGAGKLNKGTKTYTKGVDTLLKGVNTYTKGAKKLSNGVKQYVGGVNTMVDGVNTLDKSTSGLPTQYKTFGDGVKAFVNSVTTLLSEDNMKNLTEGIQSLKDGVSQVNTGLKAVQGGVSSLNENAAKLKKTEELDQCVAGLQQMKNMYIQMAESAVSAEEKQQYQQMAAVVTGAIQYIEGGEQLAAGIDAATNGKADGDSDQNGEADLAIALSKLQAATDSESSETNLATGTETLSESAKTMSGYAKQLRDNSPALLNGNEQISSGITQISNAITQLKTGGKQITSNNKALTDGADSLIKNTGTIQKNSKKITKNSPSLRKATKSLAGGTKKLASGLKKLVKSTSSVAGGINKLLDGSGDLSDGMKKFDKEAIHKLTDSVTDVTDSVGELTDRVKGVHKASQEYRSYSGLAKDMDGSVKFIMTTEEIKQLAD